MGIKTDDCAKPVQSVQDIPAIPANAAREYIADMLGELCVVAKQSGQDDLHVLLKLAAQAVRNTSP